MINGIAGSGWRGLVGAAWQVVAPRRVPGPASAAAYAGRAMERGAVAWPRVGAGEPWRAPPPGATAPGAATGARVLADLIHRMGGAASSNAKGTFVNLRV